ncbi:MAG: ABC transporter ATP-binding protein [Defluviitaleaceae bacterium]|nr:ABC transporter ATP-binding protein [Defluviitaleaceae bacterium]
MKLIEFKDVSLTYEKMEALKNISFSVIEGELIAIIGPSGCGKTSILSLISGIFTKTTGEIIKKDGLKTAYMLQKDSLLEWRSVFDNAKIGLEITKSLTKENLSYIENLIETYGLAEFKNKFPKELSGGMRQRAALIRTLAVKPEILLLDEAFSALDYQTRLAVTRDVVKILKKEKKTAIMVTHDISEAVSMASRVIVFSKRPGQILRDMKLNFTEDDPLKRRDDPFFKQYFNEIWQEIEVRYE